MSNVEIPAWSPSIVLSLVGLNIRPHMAHTLFESGHVVDQRIRAEGDTFRQNGFDERDGRQNRIIKDEKMRR